MTRLQFLKPIRGAFFLLIFIFSSTYAFAESARIIDGRTGAERSFEQMIEVFEPGSVVVMGEQHAFATHQKEQLQVLINAQERGLLTSVGLEFFNYPDQALVDSWRLKDLPESDFLNLIKWGGYPFELYKPQALVPRLGQEFLWALNAPRTLTGKVAKQGLASLSDQEKALLPPNFQIGNDRYFERFKNAGHVPDPSQMMNYFTAQSIWDDTMAWRANEFIQRHPRQTLFIIVGEFHVQYGGGLPDRLRARGLNKVHTLSLINADGLSSEEEQAAVSPSPIDGARADFVWVSRP